MSICVTDGFHDKKKGHKIYGSSWIILYKRTSQYISGSLVEHSNSAISSRGDILGMLAIHLFLKEYYAMVGNINDIMYNNMGALFTFQQKIKHIPSGATNSNI